MLLDDTAEQVVGHAEKEDARAEISALGMVEVANSFAAHGADVYGFGEYNVFGEGLDFVKRDMGLDPFGWAVFEPRGI